MHAASLWLQNLCNKNKKIPIGIISFSTINKFTFLSIPHYSHHSRTVQHSLGIGTIDQHHQFDYNDNTKSRHTGQVSMFLYILECDTRRWFGCHFKNRVQKLARTKIEVEKKVNEDRE